MTTRNAEGGIAGRILARGATDIVSQTRPAPAAGEVLIGVKRAGICGTDVHIFEGSYGLAAYPLVPGHELAGTVLEVGDGVRHVQVGDRVAVDPNVPCLACDECRRNAFNHCRNMEIVGVNRAGGFATYLTVQGRAVWSIGDLSFAAGALLEPLACVMWGLGRAKVGPGHSAIVFGAGPMGCLLLQAVRFAGASTVVAVDREPYRLAMAAELGATQVVDAADQATLARLAERGFDLVVDATGVPAVLEAGMGYARPNGVVWAFGVAPAAATVRVAPFELFRKDLTLFGSFALNRTFDQATRLAATPGFELEALVSHTVPLAEFARGFDIAMHEPRRMKVHYEINAGNVTQQ